MNETRNALKSAFTFKEVAPKKQDEQYINHSTLIPTEPPEQPIEKPKRKVGRPTAVHSDTKIARILKERGISRGKFYEMICERYPDEPISRDSISRILSGKRKTYSTATVFRMCNTLSLTPNDILNYEEQM